MDLFQGGLRERDRFLRGLVSWVGFKIARVEFEARPRFAGYYRCGEPRLSGVIVEYIASIFEEIKERPIYIFTK